MPRQAFAESEYRGAACGSRIAASEQAEYPAPALGHSEVASVKSCPRARIPEFVQGSEDREEIAARSAREQSGNILPKDVSRSEFIDGPHHVMEQARPGTPGQAGPLARDAQILTGEPAADQAHRGEARGVQGADVAVPGHAGPVAGQHPVARRVKLHLPEAAEAGPFQAQVETADPGEQTAEGQRHPSPPTPSSASSASSWARPRTTARTAPAASAFAWKAAWAGDSRPAGVLTSTSTIAPRTHSSRSGQPATPKRTYRPPRRAAPVFRRIHHTPRRSSNAHAARNRALSPSRPNDITGTPRTIRAAAPSAAASAGRGPATCA